MTGPPHENPPKVYGQWSGNPRGIPAKPDQCIKSVYGDRWIPHQCTRKRGHGPKGMYCKQHAKRYEK